MLREIRVYGELAKFMGVRSFMAEARDVAEAVRYLMHGLMLPDWDRPSLEEFEARPLFDGLWEAAGFHELAADALLLPGDALLMHIGDQQLNHVGVFIGNGMMLHHLRDHLSERDHCRPGLTGRRLRHAEASKLVVGAGW